MMKDRFLKWWAIAALAVIAINMLTAQCAYGQDTTRVVYKDSLLSSYYGQTVCDSSGKPEVWLLKGLTEKEQLSVLRHELIHARQMRKHLGGCQAAMWHYATDRFYRFDMELDAYTYQAYWDGGSLAPDEKAEYLVRFMWKNYSFPQLTYEQVSAYVLTRFKEIGETLKPP